MVHGSLLAVNALVANAALQKRKDLFDLCKQVVKLFESKNTSHTRALVGVLPSLICEFDKFEVHEAPTTGSTAQQAEMQRSETVGARKAFVEQSIL